MPYASFTQDERHFSPSGTCSVGLPLSSYFQSQEHTQLQGSGNITPCKQGVLLVTRNHSEKVFGKLIYINWASQLRCASGKEPSCQGRRQKRHGPLGQEDPLEEGTATHSSIPAWRIPRTERSLAGYSPWVTKSQTWLKWLSTHTHIHTNHSIGPFFWLSVWFGVLL